MLLSPCPLCNRSNPPTAKFCEACGVGLVALCPACGTVNEVGASACCDCSATLPASDARRIGSALQAIEPHAEPTASQHPSGDLHEADSAEPAASRAFLVRFDADGSVAVRPVPTLDTAPASGALAPLLARHLPPRRALRWQAGVATAALAAGGVAGLMAFVPRGDKAPAAGPPDVAPAVTTTPAIAPVAAAPADANSVLTTRAPLALPPPSAGPVAVAPVQAAVVVPKTPAPPRVAIRPPAVARPPVSDGRAASAESAAAVAAALTRQRVADGSLPRAAAPRGGTTCSDTVAALGLCAPEPNRKP